MKETETIPQLIRRHWMRIVVTVISTALLALVLSLVVPKQFLSEASVLPANSKLMDKQRMFGENIQELYSAYGASDDLDRLMATLNSSSVLQAVADSLHLTAHYGIDEPNARKKALKKLSKQLKMQRSEYGDISLKVWDKDPAMALKIANLILENTQHLYDEMFAGYYQRSIARLENELKVKEDLILGWNDSLAMKSSSLFSDEHNMIRRKITEYRITQMNPPAAMFILAKPELAVQYDKPNVLLNTIIAAAVAFFAVIAWIAGLSIWKSGYAKP
jgi:capsular polysaccharide biosynthesis protein